MGLPHHGTAVRGGQPTSHSPRDRTPYRCGSPPTSGLALLCSEELRTQRADGDERRDRGEAVGVCQCEGSSRSADASSEGIGGRVERHGLASPPPGLPQSHAVHEEGRRGCRAAPRRIVWCRVGWLPCGSCGSSLCCGYEDPRSEGLRG